MRRSEWLAGFVALFAGALGAGVMSCVISADLGDCNTYPHEGCPQFTGTGGHTGTGGTGGHMGTGGEDSGPPPSCIPSENTMPVGDSCGVFVSSSTGNDTTGAGTKAKPYASITKALAEAKGNPVYLCGGEEIAGAVQISADAILYGGLDCTTDWKHDPTKKTKVTSDADTIPITISGSGSKVDVFDVAVTAKGAMKDGGSSIGVLVAQATANFTRCDVTAGDGKAGAPGAPFTMSATSGVIGNAGKAACSAGTVTGADPVSSMCMPTDSIGGPGGNGTSLSGGAGTDGQPGTTMNGGKGESGSGCGAGGLGDPGADGTAGLGAAMSEIGTLSAGGLATASGGDAQPGKPGQGGGGGGGAKGGTGAGKCSDPASAGGASGGSGGSGGCGGLGGKGGQGGGASIAIASINGTLTFANVTLSVGAGGLGGNGGAGQSGGGGGDPGPAGVAKPMFASLNDACPGGKGGAGGSGGKGGGGRGGHAIGIAFTGKAPPATSAATWKMSNAGSAGMGGTGDTTGGNAGDGAIGVKADVQQFP